MPDHTADLAALTGWGRLAPSTARVRRPVDPAAGH